MLLDACPRELGNVASDTYETLAQITRNTTIADCDETYPESGDVESENCRHRRKIAMRSG